MRMDLFRCEMYTNSRRFNKIYDLEELPFLSDTLMTMIVISDPFQWSKHGFRVTFHAASKEMCRVFGSLISPRAVSRK